MTIIPKIIVNNKKPITDKVINNLKTLYELYGQRNALINTQTDIWEKIEEVNNKIQLLEPKKKKSKDSNVF